MITKDHVVLPSDKRFGALFSSVSIVVALYGWLKGWQVTPVSIFIVLGMAFLLAALVKPDVLRPLNKIWFKFGILLGKIISPLVVGLLFFVLITPIALAMRLFQRDALRLRPDSGDSYWITREQAGSDPEKFTKQF